jgi:hypothetical protein
MPAQFASAWLAMPLLPRRGPTIAAERTLPAGRMARTVCLLRELFDEFIVVAIGHIVEILNTNDIRDFLRFAQLFRSDVAHSQMPDQAPILQLP